MQPGKGQVAGVVLLGMFSMYSRRLVDDSWLESLSVGISSMPGRSLWTCLRWLIRLPC